MQWKLILRLRFDLEEIYVSRIKLGDTHSRWNRVDDAQLPRLWMTLSLPRKWLSLASDASYSRFTACCGWYIYEHQRGSHAVPEFINRGKQLWPETHHSSALHNAPAPCKLSNKSSSWQRAAAGKVFRISAIPEKSVSSMPPCSLKRCNSTMKAEPELNRTGNSQHPCHSKKLECGWLWSSSMEPSVYLCYHKYLINRNDQLWLVQTEIICGHYKRM